MNSPPRFGAMVSKQILQTINSPLSLIRASCFFFFFISDRVAGYHKKKILDIQPTTKQPLNSHKPPILENMPGIAREVRMDFEATLTHRNTSVIPQEKTYIHQFCTDPGWRLEGLIRAMLNKDGWPVCVKGIRAVGTLRSLRYALDSLA